MLRAVALRVRRRGPRLLLCPAAPLHRRSRCQRRLAAAAATLPCPSCGHHNVVLSKFCNQCGSATGAARDDEVILALGLPPSVTTGYWSPRGPDPEATVAAGDLRNALEGVGFSGQDLDAAVGAGREVRLEPWLAGLPPEVRLRIVRGRRETQEKLVPTAAAESARAWVVGAAAGVVGGLTGLLGSLVGAGGGPFCVPLLSICLGLPHTQCVGTALLSAHTTCVVAGVTTMMYTTETIPYSGIMVLGVVAPAFGVLGARLSGRLPQKRLKQLFALFLLFSAGCIVMDAKQVREPYPFLAELVASTEGYVAFHVALATVSGLGSGLLGIAGGSIVVPLMAMTGCFPWPAIMATSLLAMIPTSAASAVTHWRMGNVVVRLVPPLVAGTAMGAFAGSHAMSLVDESTRKQTCAAVMLMLVSVQLGAFPRLAALLSRTHAKHA